jgi:hypothetical protein
VEAPEHVLRVPVVVELLVAGQVREAGRVPGVVERREEVLLRWDRGELAVVVGLQGAVDGAAERQLRARLAR